MLRADEMTGRNENEKTVLGFYQTLMKRDLAAFADLWADDAVQDMPFAAGVEGLEPSWRGKQTILSHYNRSIPGRRDHVFHIDRLHQTKDPNIIIVEARGKSTISENGRVYDQRYVFIFHLRDGKIVLNREHFNPIVFQKAFDGFTVGKGAQKH
jgi:uncharacterized protein